MRVAKISVRQLFGIPTFNYDIELKTESRITIIHGPNGSGKTVLFKMLAGLFNINYFIFWKYPFKEFQVDFDDGEYILVEREFDERDKRFLSPKVTYSKSPTQPLSLEVDRDLFRYLTLSSRRRLSSNEFEEYINLGEIENYLNVARFDVNRLVYRFGTENLSEKVREPKWLEKLRKKLTINFIDTNRLLVNKSEGQSDRKQSVVTVTAITENSNNLSSRIQAKILEADTQAKTLDRTFPSRVVKNVVDSHGHPLKYDTIRAKLEELEIKRKRLIDAGLLESGKQETDFQIPETISDSQEERTLRSVLAMYIQDTENKLKVYQELADKIELFKEIIQEMLRYKQILISKDGFEIKSDTGRSIPLEELSSGEQHTLVLIYNLLFRERDNVDELILIDEPEISLHISWQKRFIDDLSRINKLSNFDVIIATHSPSIINGRLDLLVGIQGATDKEI